MSDQGQPASETETETKPKIDIVRDVKRSEKLRIHLSDGTAIEGAIALFDRFNLKFQGDDGKTYWIPKHAVVYGELL